MAIEYIDGIRLYRSITAGLRRVVSRQEYLNKINVFPVPDEASKAIDNRLERSQNPQYQTTEDKKRAKDTHEAKECDLCSGIDY